MSRSLWGIIILLSQAFLILQLEALVCLFDILACEAARIRITPRERANDALYLQLQCITVCEVDRWPQRLDSVVDLVSCFLVTIKA
jgi:hypothetical protein